MVGRRPASSPAWNMDISHASMHASYPPSNQELLDAIALDVVPRLLQLSELSQGSAVMAVGLADLVIRACRPREMLLLLLEVIQTLSARCV